MGFGLSQRSNSNLVGVHPRLVAVVRRAIQITEIDFMVTEGRRTVERQKTLVAKGASKTMNSKHITGHAVDLAAMIGPEIRWDWPLYAKLNTAMQQAAAEQGTKVTWGGSWRTFKDGPHWEIDPKVYPF